MRIPGSPDSTAKFTKKGHLPFSALWSALWLCLEAARQKNIRKIRKNYAIIVYQEAGDNIRHSSFNIKLKAQ